MTRSLTGRRKKVYDLIWRNMAFMRLAMATRFVEGVPPVSAMLVGQQGAGKTHILEALADGDRFRLQADLTQNGLEQAFLDALREGMLGLVIKDFGTLLNKSKPTAQRMITWLAHATAEGMGRVDRGGDRWRDFQGVQIGIYTAMTERDFMLQMDLLETNAFLSRLVPVAHFFSLTEDRIVRDLIREGLLDLTYRNWWPEEMEPEPVDLPEGEYDGLIEKLVKIQYRYCQAVYASQRTYNLFETLLKASARIRCANRVESCDAEYLEKFWPIWTQAPFVPVAKGG